MDPMSYPYRISTITATGSVSTEIDLDIFYDSLEVCQDDEEGVVYAEYGKKKSETIYKGFSKKFLITKRKVKTATKRFDNQVTIVYRFMEEAGENLLNMKVFKNGNVQLTGVKYIEQGDKMVSRIVERLRGVAVERPEVVKSMETLGNSAYKVRLINSDFRIGWAVKREWLHRVFTSSYENDCSFEPCIYPGVKIQYFYNTCSPCPGDGLCHCADQCFVGKGSGTGEGQCKKITIAVFQSGCVIITGAQNHVQIQEAYGFITGVLAKHRCDIEKRVAAVAEPTPKKIVLINKKNIVYPVIVAPPLRTTCDHATSSC